ncbi:MAG: nucleoside triphosphate pyrophosphohydrolase [Crocinitomicaceae bacterium]|jgi:XTP/dITP diphosphohydrolase|nr:nucleoside triphosphate pyrophosphohydrolase [Crocinitomicaceae bacterium]
MDARLAAFQRLLDIMDDLREKCPWDKKQDFNSLRTLTIEETYELADALLENDFREVEGELGDLFLHLVFYCKIGSEQGEFSVESVLNRICDKLIYRHPHIYGDTEVADEEEVKANWEKLKLKEGKKSVLEGVPKSLPALVKAYRIQDKVKGVGFDWDEQEDVWNKITEEVDELREAIQNKDKEEAELEFGDVLFSLINVSRFIDVNPENALERTNLKFIRRFQLMEEMILADQKDLTAMNLQEMDVYWEKAKKQLRAK